MNQDTNINSNTIVKEKMVKLKTTLLSISKVLFFGSVPLFCMDEKDNDIGIAIILLILGIISFIIINVFIKFKNISSYNRSNFFSSCIATGYISLMIYSLSTNMDESVGGWVFISTMFILPMILGAIFLINWIIDEFFYIIQSKKDA